MNPSTMRTIRVDEPDDDHTWLWLAAGAALGIVAGVVVAERMSGRKVSLRGLAARGRRLASSAFDHVLPLLEHARSFKDMLSPDDDRDEDDEEDPETAGIGSRAAGRDADDVDDDLDEDDNADDPTDEARADALDARVLEAFSNDPVLASRAVEIEEDGDGAIMLHGRVRTPREVQHAVTIARGVPGVHRVRQRLTVKERAR